MSLFSFCGFIFILKGNIYAEFYYHVPQKVQVFCAILDYLALQMLL